METRTLASVLAPLAAFGVDVLIQLAVYRFRPRLGLLRSEAVGAIGGLSALFLFSWPAFTDPGVFVVDLLIYGSLVYCYFHFINLGETARRIRLLREFDQAGGVMTLEEILRRYNGSEILERRLARLLGTGQIVKRNGRYLVGKPLMLVSAWVIIFLKHLFLKKGSEFEG